VKKIAAALVKKINAALVKKIAAALVKQIQYNRNTFITVNASAAAAGDWQQGQGSGERRG
jgi:hypothetical protein